MESPRSTVRMNVGSAGPGEPKVAAVSLSCLDISRTLSGTGATIPDEAGASRVRGADGGLLLRALVDEVEVEEGDAAKRQHREAGEKKNDERGDARRSKRITREGKGRDGG